MEAQDHPIVPFVSTAARIATLAAMDFLVFISTNLAALAAALVADLGAAAILLGLAPAPVPARRRVPAELRRRPREVRLTGGVP